MHRVRSILFEAAVIAAVGLTLSLAANALSPRGLQLTRNYFPTDFRHPAAPDGATNHVASAVNSGNDSDASRQRLQQHGLHLIASNEVAALFRDVRYEQGIVVIVDARDDAHYQAGHIPGA